MAFTTPNIRFASCLFYLGGRDSLLTIELVPDSQPNKFIPSFTVDIPEFDGQEYFEEFLHGDLNIADALELLKSYDEIQRMVRDMRRRGDECWTSPSWIAGKR